MRSRDIVAGAEDLFITEWRHPKTWDDLAVHTRKVLALTDKTASEKGPLKRWVLFSGGNDSLVLLHFLRFGVEWPIDAVVHINTGTGVIDEAGRPVTTDFARTVVENWGLEFLEAHPPETFEQVFIEQNILDGLPGATMHNIAFTRLKQRALDRVIAEAKTSGVSRFSLATGVRYQESRRRMGYGDKLVTRAGAQVWSNPIYYATNRMMADYRTFYDLPKNPVAEHLHISGECLCGCFASPGEFDEIAFFYPRTAERIRGWEQAAKERGCKNWLWGVRHEHGDWMKAALEAGRITEDDLWPAADLCGTCVSRSELIAGIREQGL